MCQIISLNTTVKKLRKIVDEEVYIDILQEMMEEKGGDYYSLQMYSKDYSFRDSSNINIAEILINLIDFIKAKNIKGEIGILLFSRQRPEMERGEVEEQPYVSAIQDKIAFAVHGTIHNDKELALDLDATINADTEILKHIPYKEWGKAKGTYAVIGMLKNGQTMIYEHGLKIYKSRIILNGKHVADIVSTANLKAFEQPVINLNRAESLTENRALFVSFSGGMDISLSLYDTLDTGKYDRVLLNYFAWGSIAEPGEIGTLDDFLAFYRKEFPGIDFDLDIVEADRYFEEYFDINEAPLPKISIHHDLYDDDEEHNGESEAPMAYVPYRNTQFALLMASKAEAYEIKHVDFLFGLNLSEGMVYMDNSEGWLDAIQETIRYGGKDSTISGTYNVIAPFFSRTKTNMLQEFKEMYGVATLEQLLSLSKSCYYPKSDGTPCGKCGSCILRNKSISKLEV